MKQNQVRQSGQVLVLALVIVGLVMINTLVIVSGSQLFSQNTNYTIQSSQALDLAEAGVDKALAALNATGGNYNGETETLFGSGSFSVTITTKDALTNIIAATGYVPNEANPKVKRTIQIQASKGAGISFVYGMLVGEGGISMGNGATFNGSVYSNGDISGGNNSTFTGDVYVAGGTQAIADQQSDCSDVNCADFIFGKNVVGNDRLDIAQSFQPLVAAAINKVSLKLKKYGSPPNLTVRLLKDNSGRPDKNNVLASGLLSANLVTDQYSFVDVTFTTTSTLTENTTYWVLLDTSLDSNNYWSWSIDTLQGYPRGSAAWSSSWQASNPSWNGINGDLGFKTWMGGEVNSINLGNGSRINGDVHANTITGNLTVFKDAYYQTLGSSVVVQGTRYPGFADPSPAVFPISDVNIAGWKNEAEATEVTFGNIIGGNGCTVTLGPGKIVGNVSLANSCNAKVISPVWITGTLSAGNFTKFTLDQSFGVASGIIIIDGRASLANGVDFLGSGSSGSYLMLLSTYDSIMGGEGAISSGNSSISGILYAPYGEVELANGASFKEITAWKIDLGNSATLNYQTGLAQVFFSSGPSGSYSLVKGTYQLK